MSHKNYKNYSKMSTENSEEIVDEAITELKTAEDLVGKTNPEVEQEPDVSVANGIVSGCNKLNIREEPKLESKIVCVIAAGSNLMINLSELNDKWFSVCTETGAEGYCMKDFVTLKQ